MAEATLAISFTPHGSGVFTDLVDADALRLGRATPADRNTRKTVELVACGKAFPKTRISIVGERAELKGEREVGEIVVAGPGVTPGYFENAQASEESFRAGALHTGDLGYLADGHLYICGRAKDLIIIRGANIHPQDIEWSVAEVPGIRRDNVVAFSSLIDGEEQLVVAAEGNSSDAPELRKTVATKVAESHSLKVHHVAIVKVGSLPKTSSGKVQRRRTRQLFEDGQLEENGEPNA
jgi:fatty-acyl-CoA synthase